MYVIVNAYAKTRTLPNEWLVVDLTKLKLKDVYRLYKECYVNLTNSLLGDTKLLLDLNKLKTKLLNSEDTLVAYIAKLGKNSLPTTKGNISLINRYAKYVDGFRAGYKFQPVSYNKAIDANIPLGDRESLWCTKTGVDGRTVVEQCMVAVNGYWHYLDANKNGFWVLEAMASQQHCKLNLIGLLSFKDLGKLSYVKFSSKDLFSLDSEGYKNVVGIKTKVKLDNKTLILVIGGYMHILDSKVFYQYNDNSILIHLDNLPLLERYQESSQYLNLDYLPFERSSKNPNLVNKADFFSDTNLVALLTGPHSFLVVLDNPDIQVTRTVIRTPPTPQLAISWTEPNYPLIQGVGKVANYWSVYGGIVAKDHKPLAKEYLKYFKGSGLDETRWSLFTGDNQWHQYLIHTQPKSVVATSDQSIGVQPTQLSINYYLIISSPITIQTT